MKYEKFIISNYKGIKHLELDLNIKPDCKIYSLVGLNESGKSTILEAINDFVNTVPKEERHLLIPKNLASGFTGEVEIKAILGISAEDKKEIKKFLIETKKSKESLIEIDDSITINKIYYFENSQPTKTNGFLTHYAKVKNTSRSKFQELDDDTFYKLWRYINEKMRPEIIFYRDFLSKFPERILLNSKEPQDKKYAEIIEDVLTSINPSYNLQSSILERLDNPSHANRQALEAIENKLAQKISQTVFSAWNKIQKINRKEIVVKITNEEDEYYIRLSVKEGYQTYSISERSLGFRWFFSFLFYTEFRKERIKNTGEVLFLLDEPASNLHQTALKSILAIFENISKKSKLLYTTHNHHLINPEWLGTTYIVRNKSLNYDDNDSFNAAMTEIEVYKYKQFIASYPKDISYFQPILDVLEYQPGLLELIPNIVVTEGKFDYFILKYFREIVFSNLKKGYSFYPGQGATKLDMPISLYESWGQNYLVILDSDKEGIQQKKRYISNISNDKHIFTLEDIDKEYKNICLEDLFEENEKKEITKEFNSALNTYNKNAFNTGIQTLYFEKRVPIYITSKTKKRIKKILDFVENKLIKNNY